MTDLIGKRLGQYQILEEIGRGGMAVVYKAYQPSLDRYVAVKVLLPQLSQDPELLQRFNREARSAAMLQHPSIIRVYDVGQEKGVHYLVMDYLSGPSLAVRLKREGALDSHVALAILQDVGDALDQAHAQGVIHRDVKPSNILFSADGRAILSDFGIAKPLADSRLTQTGTTVGTPAYMSPEQVEGRTVDGRSDLYSLGIVLYEMLTGQVPFQADTPVAVLYKQVHQGPSAPSQLNPAISAQVDRIILRALQKDPKRRYASAGEMLRDFAKAANAEPAGAGIHRAARPGEKPTEQPAPRRTPTPAKPATPPPQRSTSNSAVLMGAIAGLAIIAVIVGLVIRPSDGNPTRTPTQIGTPTRTLHTISTGALPPTGGPTPSRTTAPTPTGTRKITATPLPSPTRTRSATPTPSPSPSPTPLPHPVATPYVRVASSPDRLNVRSGPGEEYDILTKAYDGQVLPLMGRDDAGEWLKVRASDGTEGWVASKWTQASVSVSSLPVLPRPPTPVNPRIDPRFRSDEMTIARGGCTTLRWDVDNVQAIYLDGRGVAGHGTQEVCPSSTQTYTLVVLQRDGQRVSWPLTITVSGEIETFELMYRGCLPHNLTAVGQVKGQVFDRNGNIISNAYVEIKVNGQSGLVPPGRSNEQGWYEWNLTPGQVARFVRLTVNGREVTFTRVGFEVKAISGCYQRVDFRQR
jgi:serine/threonine protein kinase